MRFAILKDINHLSLVKCIRTKYACHVGASGFQCHFREYTDSQHIIRLSSFPFVHWDASGKVSRVEMWIDWGPSLIRSSARKDVAGKRGLGVKSYQKPVYAKHDLGCS